MLDILRDYHLYRRGLNRFRYILIKMYLLRETLKKMSKKDPFYKYYKNQDHSIEGIELIFSGKIGKQRRSREISIKQGILDYQKVNKVRDSAIIKRRSKFGILSVRVYITYKLPFVENPEKKTLKKQFGYLNMESLLCKKSTEERYLQFKNLEHLDSYNMIKIINQFFEVNKLIRHN
jgi:hypothetical protein